MSVNSKHAFDSAPLNSKIDSDLEVELWRGSFSTKSMVGSWLMAVVVSALVFLAINLVRELRVNGTVWLYGVVVVALIWSVLILGATYRKLSQRFELTTQRLKHRDGILFRTLSRMELIDVDDVFYRQGPIQALLGVGDIIVMTSDKTHPKLVLRGIDRVDQVVDLMDDARRKERRRRGLHVNN
jgi:membrane protein YdbS with pleckstrin-like domain